MQRFGQPVEKEARVSMDDVCARVTRSIIRRRVGMVERAMEGNRLGDAERAANQLEDELRQSEVVASCPLMADRVEELLVEFIPGVRTAVAVPKVTVDLEAAFHAVADPWQLAREALATKGTTIEEAPAFLATADGQETYRAHVAQCVHAAKSLSSLGVGADYGLRAPETSVHDSIPLRDAARLCRRVDKRVDELFKRVQTHNVAYHAEQRRKWEWTHLHGWGMQKVYNKLGRPSATTKAGEDSILWTYRDAPVPDKCTYFTFTARGAQLSRREGACSWKGATGDDAADEPLQFKLSTPLVVTIE
jgi:hypothetical protein